VQLPHLFYIQKTHKAIHTLVTAKPSDDPSTDVNAYRKYATNWFSLGGFYNPFPNFAFTGPLRPIYPLTPPRQVPDHIPRPDYVEDEEGRYPFATEIAV